MGGGGADVAKHDGAAAKRHNRQRLFAQRIAKSSAFLLKLWELLRRCNDAFGQATLCWCSAGELDENEHMQHFKAHTKEVHSPTSD